MGARERTWALMFFALSQRGPGGSPLSKLSPAVMADLRAELSPAAQLQWNAAAGNPDDLKQLLSGWVRQSMERHMGCALGACGACVTRVLSDDGKDWRYSRICMEGPTYDEKCLVLE